MSDTDASPPKSTDPPASDEKPANEAGPDCEPRPRDVDRGDEGEAVRPPATGIRVADLVRAMERSDQEAPAPRRRRSRAPFGFGSYDPFSTAAIWSAFTERNLAAGWLHDQSVLSAMRAASGVAFEDLSLSRLSALRLLGVQQEAITRAIAGIRPAEIAGVQSFFERQTATGERLWQLAKGVELPMLDRAAAQYVHSSSVINDLVLRGAGLGADALLARQTELLADSYNGMVNGVVDDALASLEGSFDDKLASAAIGAASSIVEDAAGWLSRLDAVDADPFNPVPQPVRPNIFEALADEVAERCVELVVLAPAEVDEEVANTLSARIHAVGQEVANLRYSINVSSQTRDSEAVFKPTIKSEHFNVLLVTSVVRTRREFEEFSEGLFEYVYESSGGWKRITPYLVDFPKVADAIKHLRLYAAHDIEHGDEKRIRRKAAQVGDHLERLCGKRVPSKQVDWMRAQLRFLEELAAFLRQLDTQLKS